MNIKNISFFGLIVLTIVSIATTTIYKKLKRLYKKLTYISSEYDIKNSFDINYFSLLSQSVLTPISRKVFIDSIDKVDGLKLEIGPYFTPVLTGNNVKYFDILDSEKLKKLAENDPLISDLSKIPKKIDYVEQFGDMSIIEKKFQIVFSSHNIEHQVNLVKHFNDVERLLVKGGKFYLAIPDKRFCFDHFIATTPLSEVLAVYWQSPKRHSLQTILAMKCETTHNDSTRHWNSNDESVPKFLDTANCFKEWYKEYLSSNKYIDSHKWRFVPESFEVIINTLNKLKLTSLKVEKIYDTAQNSHEFYAILVKE